MPQRQWPASKSLYRKCEEHNLREIAGAVMNALLDQPKRSASLEISLHRVSLTDTDGEVRSRARLFLSYAGLLAGRDYEMGAGGSSFDFKRPKDAVWFQTELTVCPF